MVFKCLNKRNVSIWNPSKIIIFKHSKSFYVQYSTQNSILFFSYTLHLICVEILTVLLIVPKICKFFILNKNQSQFRFDNECYLNLPDNHKRVSVDPTKTTTVDLNADIVGITKPAVLEEDSSEPPEVSVERRKSSVDEHNDITKAVWLAAPVPIAANDVPKFSTVPQKSVMFNTLLSFEDFNVASVSMLFMFF